MNATRFRFGLAVAAPVALLAIATTTVASVPVMDFMAFAMNIQHLKTDKKKDGQLDQILDNYKTMNATLGAPGRASATPADFLGQASASSPFSALQAVLPAGVAASKNAALDSAAAIGRREYASSLIAAVSGQIAASKSKPDAAGVKSALSALGLGDLAGNQPAVDALTQAVSSGSGLANLQPLRDFFARVPVPTPDTVASNAASTTGTNAQTLSNGNAASASTHAARKTFADLRTDAKSRFYAPSAATLTPEMRQAYESTRLGAQRAGLVDALASAASAPATAEMTSAERQQMLTARIQAASSLRGDIQANTSPTLATAKAHARLDAAAALLLHVRAGSAIINDVEIAPARTTNQ